ncbi:DUF2157 domain-containing protein [Noviherbaspirillum cavernae]|uniref:DUF2157 domain-containing protein n=1 Tax=Noviherbaspirillum cavernae TaxID=2320862 RepID=A0A418X388_9BURK|nr:DUF2157 domain-containing protein [Noviherbaspirillum cavernae]RJG06851.1 DUF2157 domain-containing protein [Noviherbaspirillum cavernae]
MTVRREDLEAAVKAGVLDPVAIDALFAFLVQRDTQSPHNRARNGARNGTRFNGTNVLYYLGGMLAIGAATLFTTIAVDALGMGALLGLSVAYALAAIGVAAWLEKRSHGVPAGIFATLAIALVPLAVYALQHVLGFWSDGPHAQHYRDYHRYIDWRWLVMELATLVAGAAMLWRFRYPFLMMPVAVTLWYMGMDIVPALLTQASGEPGGWFGGAAWELRKMISLVFGLVMLLFAFFVDLRSRHDKDYAFWLYLFGLLTFCGALSLMGSGSLSGKLVYLAIHFGLVFIGAVLGRRTFAVFGGIGIAIVLGDLSWHLFRNSLAFVLVLTLLGFALIWIGLWWSKNEVVVSVRMRAMLPDDLRELIEARR